MDDFYDRDAEEMDYFESLRQEQEYERQCRNHDDSLCWEGDLDFQD